VNITDGFHGYTRIDEPYKYQDIIRIQPITIKRGCWIGQNVVICPGVTIGEMTVVGANSVVTQSISDRCIAVGAPAKVIKKWDEAKEGWIAVSNQTR
jgi:acetyltransferase-like isoleucine patch superfamily enzyme